MSFEMGVWGHTVSVYTCVCGGGRAFGLGNDLRTLSSDLSRPKQKRGGDGVRHILKDKKRGHSLKKKRGKLCA